MTRATPTTTVVKHRHAVRLVDPAVSVPRLDTLTGLRFVAAFLVILSHVRLFTVGRVRDVLDALGGGGAVGVEFFFMLSGFVLAWSCRPSIMNRVFWRRRFARIYPAYFIAMVVAIPITYFQYGATPLLPLLAGLLLVQAWIPIESYYFGYNGVSWSLSAEAFFYALFPALLTIVRRANRWAAAMLAVTAGTVIVVDIAGRFIVKGQYTLGNWAIYIFPLKRLGEFVCGILLAELLRQGRLPRLAMRPSLLASAVAYAAVVKTSVLAGGEAWMLLPFACLLVAGAQRDMSGEGSAFSARQFVWLGEVSYCLYLVHQLVMKALSLANGVGNFAGMQALAFVLVSMALSLLAAVLLHNIVERPMERRLRGDGQNAVSDGGGVERGATDPPQGHGSSQEQTRRTASATARTSDALR